MIHVSDQSSLLRERDTSVIHSDTHMVHVSHGGQGQHVCCLVVALRTHDTTDPQTTRHTPLCHAVASHFSPMGPCRTQVGRSLKQVACADTSHHNVSPVLDVIHVSWMYHNVSPVLDVIHVSSVYHVVYHSFGRDTSLIHRDTCITC